MEGLGDPILLPRESPVLRLVQRIRDEAHRFAITYHRTLRNKRTFTTELTEIPGVGALSARRLLKVFGSVSGVRFARETDLAGIVGVRLAAVVSRAETILHGKVGSVARATLADTSRDLREEDLHGLGNAARGAGRPPGATAGIDGRNRNRIGPEVAWKFPAPPVRPFTSGRNRLPRRHQRPGGLGTLPLPTTSAPRDGNRLGGDEPKRPFSLRAKRPDPARGETYTVSP